ncbi:MAG: ABC transporter permease [Chitinophagales bacterium]
MLRSYFKIALRNMFRQPGFSILNLSGLAIGMASAILILLWIQNEVSFDRFHKKGDRLYEVWSMDNKPVDGQIRAYTSSPEIMAPALKQDFTEFEEVIRVGWNQTLLFGIGDKSIKANGIVVDTAFLKMFSFPLLQGNPNTALKDPNSLVVTQKMAIKLFGTPEAIGKTVKIDNDANFTVTAVAKDPPNNTDFRFEFLLSYERLTQHGWVDKDWTDFSVRTFALLKPNTSPAEVNSKIRDIIGKYSEGRAHSDVFLYPVSQLRLYSEFENGKPSGGRIMNVRLFGIIAAFILLVACINFMNLSTARSEKRAKEVGIRKVSGALKRSLVFQFLSESVLLSFLSGLIALLLVALCLPAFNTLTNKQLSLDYSSAGFWLGLASFILFTGMLAGSYPSFFLSSFNPVAVLKGTFKKANALVTPRKLLVVLQFSFAIILMICTIVVKKQIEYGLNRKTGYDKTNMAFIFMEGDIPKNYEMIKSDLMNSGAAVGVNQTHAPMTQVWSSGHSLRWQGKVQEVTFNRSSTDGNLENTAGLHFVEGRDIDLKNFPSDSTGCVINETAAKTMGFKNVIGQTIYDEPTTWHVVGVVKDFILESPYESIKPLIFKGPKSGRNVMNIRFNSSRSTPENLASAEKIFKKYNPAYPFEYRFMDEEYNKKFSDEKLLGELAALFAGLTIFISCLGLFGLATFMAEARIKEIGVRKVLGASVASITTLLSKDFLKLVIVSILIATPVAYWVMSKWLLGYNYRISLSWTVFLMAGLLAMLIALISVSYQSIKASIANPVKSLRSE